MKNHYSNSNMRLLQRSVLARALVLVTLVCVHMGMQGQWVQQGQDIDGEMAGDELGDAVSISADGSTVAVGAPENGNRGHVRVYNFDGAAWVQQGQDVEGESFNDRFGGAVCLSADRTTMAVGATRNSGNGSDAGHVRVFNYDGTSWVQLGQDIDGEAANDLAGGSVSLSSDGGIVAIGANGNNNGNGIDAGHVRIYSYNGTNWVQRGQDIDGEAPDDFSGVAVSLSSDGETVAVGAPRNDGNGDDAGHVRVYNYNGISWVQQGQDLEGEAFDDFSGESVSLNSEGSIVAIGSRWNAGNGFAAGHVRVYSYNGTNWVQQGQDIDGEVGNDFFGFSLDLDSTGLRLVAGAPFNDENGTNAGHVRAYSYNGSNWVQQGLDIDGEAMDDFSGFSVKLSSDGATVIIGAPSNSANGANAGHARIYSLAPVTISENAFGNAISMYPNPTNDWLTIELGDEQVSSIVIVNSVGKEVLAVRKLMQPRHRLSLATLRQGVYFVKVTDGNQHKVMKLLKQ